MTNEQIQIFNFVQHIILTVHHWAVQVIGNVGIVAIFVFIIYKIYQKCKIKSVTKKYAKKINDSQILQKTFSSMTPEEKEKLEKTGKAETTYHLDLDTMKTTTKQ